MALSSRYSLTVWGIEKENSSMDFENRNPLHSHGRLSRPRRLSQTRVYKRSADASP